MPSRRERVIERVDAIDPEETRAWLRRDWMAAAIDAYEAELAADLESEETEERALSVYREMSVNHSLGSRAHMRAALRSVLEEER